MIVHEKDNVEVLLQAEGNIPVGHKRALKFIAEGEQIIKYGHPIGRAKCDINEGEWVHSHNLRSDIPLQDEYQYTPIPGIAENEASTLGTTDNETLASGITDNEKLASGTANDTTLLTFKGYIRENGEVGVRNELWIIPTVGCVASLCEETGRAFAEESQLPVRVLTHPYGCSQLGDDHQRTADLLLSLAQHPNAGGVLIVGLGCENNQVSALKQRLPESERIRYIETQKVEDEQEVIRQMLHDLATVMSQDEATECPLSKLRIGLKCGGSDAFSGLTANPLLGKLTDLLAPQGAYMVLTEVPEMFGAERLLMARCRNKELFDSLVDLINDFKAYFVSHNQPVGENPSPGNHDGGITTLEEKSLGCIQKGGSAPVEDVIRYTQRLKHPGLTLLEAPGNDLVAATALAASGCQMVLFTTGRGTPFSTCVPTLKISTNTALFQRKQNWMDFNAGELLDGTSMADLLQQLLKLVIDTANGQPAKGERLNSHPIAIWKGGVTL